MTPRVVKDDATTPCVAKDATDVLPPYELHFQTAASPAAWPATGIHSRG